MRAPEVEALSVPQWMENYKLFLRIQNLMSKDFDTGKWGSFCMPPIKKAPKGLFGVLYVLF
jgi:hypothetical protein